MQKITIISIIVFFGFAILWTGCGIIGKQEATTAQIAQAPASTEPTDVPEWFTNIPTDPDHLYAAKTALAWDLQNAFDMAKQSGMVDVSSQIETKVSSMFKRFSEEIGAGEDAELRAQTLSVSKSVVEEVIKGCSTVKQERSMEGDKHRAYVLMKMPVRLANSALVNKIKGDKDMYTQFRASQAFQEMEAEVAKQME